MWEILSNHTKINRLILATTMYSHATLGKKEVVQWRGNAELKT